MLCLSGFELYSRWVPLHKSIYSCVDLIDLKSLFFDIIWYIIRQQWTSIRSLLESTTKTGLEIIHKDYMKRFKVQQAREKLRGRVGRLQYNPSFPSKQYYLCSNFLFKMKKSKSFCFERLFYQTPKISRLINNKTVKSKFLSFVINV